MNDTSKQCPKCGAPIPAEAPQGLCPKCLMAQASMPTETIEVDLARPAPPSLAEVAAAFPQLEILELIGQGGMGFVYKARQPKLERFVALKILPPSSTPDPRFAERFTREGRLLARLSHPNIVIIHDFGQAGRFFYLLMEYVDGANLRQAMQAGRFTPEQALAIVPKICDALQFAHNEGILHRDIKPENILLDSKGRVKIADFGIAKLIGEPQAEAHLTGTGGTLGTPHYMAPEQVERPASVDHRADIYSLGVVFYEMLTGELPLGRFQPPSQKVRVDVRLDDVVLHALEKEPSRRYQHASEVRTAVDTITANTGGAAPPPSRPSATLAARPTRGRAIKAGIAVFLLTALAATLFASNLTGAHVRGSLALGILSGVVTGGLTAIFVGLFSAWRGLGTGAATDQFWRRFAVAAATFIAALVLIPMAIIFFAMLVPAFMKARDSRAQAAQAQIAAKQAALAAREVQVSGTVTDFNTGERLFLNPEKYSPVSPQPGQLDWGFKAFVPPHSLATFLFVVWSNGVPAVDQGFSTYFKVGPAGGIDIAFCSVSCYPEATSREFSNLSEPQRTQFLTGWSYPRGADASNAMHWNVNLGANSTAGAIRAMPLPLYHRVEAALPQNVSSGCQLRFPLIEFEHPANSPSNGWSGVDLRIFLEHLNVPPVRQLPNEIDMTKYIAGWGVRGTLEEAIKKIRDTPLSGAASATTNSRAGAQTGELEQLLAQLREARTKYTDQNPLVVSLLERIERLREQNR